MSVPFNFFHDFIRNFTFTLITEKRTQIYSRVNFSSDRNTADDFSLAFDPFHQLFRLREPAKIRQNFLQIERNETVSNGIRIRGKCTLSRDTFHNGYMKSAFTSRINVSTRHTCYLIRFPTYTFFLDIEIPR